MIAMLALLAVLAAPRSTGTHGPLSTPAGGAVRVTIRTGSVTAPDSLPAGWTRFRMLADAPDHAPALFRLPPGTTKAALAAFLANLDTAAATPKGALAMGGRIANDSGEIVVELTPGRYVFTCLTKNDDGHRHAIAGETRYLTVTAAHATKPPTPHARVSMQMTDFAFVGADRWSAGSYLVRVENVGRQDHQFRIARLPRDVTADSAIRSGDPRRVVTPVTGLGRMGRSVAYLPVHLTPGTYMLYCLVHDPATGRTHEKLGMYRVIHVR